MNRLKDKRALVTGGTTGIGLETAKLFLEEGAKVIVTGSNPANIEAAAAELGAGAAVIKADAGSVAEQAKIADAVKARFGHLDILFVNAGVADFRPLNAWDEAGYDRSFAINVKGPFFLTQALLPVFAKPASIVLNTSINARIGMPASSVYAATKAALISLARTLSGELVERGIRVNAVSPGPVATPLHDKLGLTGEALDVLVDQIPVGRRGTSREIAQAVLYFASDESAFAVGSELIVDGGMSNI